VATKLSKKLIVIIFSAPSSLQTEGETNPGSVIDPTPEFSAIYNDQDNGDAAFYYRIQIAASTNWTNLIWDSGKTALATSTPKGQRTEEIPYAGTALLADKTTYYWRIKLWDRIDFEGAWSTETASFYYANSYLQNLSYTYDKVGNITRIIDSSNMNTAKTLDFSYDDLHRLTVASSTNAVSGGNYRETYNYNAIGNITNKSDVGNYLYQGTNYANPHAATSINGATYSYDQNGNLTNDGAWTHSWDYNNRLTQSNNGTATTTYQYDQDGNRIKKAETTPTASSTTIYINQYYEVEGQDIRKYIFAGGERVASLIRQTIDINPDCTPPPSGDWTISVSCTFTGKARAQGDVTVNAGAVLTIADHSRLEIDLKNHKLLVRHNGGVLIKKGGTLRQTTEDSLDPEIVNSTAYHHADHLSGANADTDENGDVVQLLDYYPYGETRIDEKAGTYENDYKFAGYIRDEDSGLDYVGARYYNSGIGKWISQDPLFNIIGSGDINKDYENEYLSDPQKINSYSYVNNNPLYYIDPNGLTGIVFYGGNQENKNYFRDLAYKQAQTMIQNGFSEPIYVMEGSSPEMWNKTLNTKTDISYIGYYGHGSEQSLYLGNTTKTKPGTNMQTNTTASIMSNNKVSDFNPATDITVGQLSTKNIRKGDIKIELYSCRGGVGKNSIAEAFSRHFGASVQGARGGINFNSSGQAYISRPIYKEPSLFLEDALRSRLGLPNASIWRIFNN
jgi:RHS repeat-associated protein